MTRAAARSRWALVAILVPISALNYGDRLALAAVYPLLRSDLGLTDLDLGLVGSAFLWAYGPACAGAGYLADRLSRSRVVALSTAVWSVATLAVAYAGSLGQLLAARVALGLAQSPYGPASLALIADHHGPATRGAAIALNLAGMSAGLIGSSTFVGYVGQTWNWRDAFRLLGWLGLGLAALAAFVLRDGPVPPGARRAQEVLSAADTLRLLARTPAYGMVVAQSMLSSSAVGMFWQWLPLYYREAYGLSLAGAGFSGTFMIQGTALAGILAGGFASDRFGRHAPRRRPLVMALCYLAAAPLPLVFMAEPGYALLSTTVAAFSLVRAFGQANENLILCDLVAPRARATAIGIVLMANAAASSVAILAAAWLRGRHGLGFAFACLSAVVALAALSALAAFARMPRRASLSGPADPN
jgi:sugar phosphate permease